MNAISNTPPIAITTPMNWRDHSEVEGSTLVGGSTGIGMAGSVRSVTRKP